MAMYELERDVERHLVNEVKRLGGYCLKWVSPGVRGVPDRIVLLSGGRIAFAELKRHDGELAAWQRKWLAILARLGFTVGVLRSRADVNRFLGDVTNGI